MTNLQRVVTLSLLILCSSTLAQDLQPPGAYAPLVEACGSVDGIVCVNKYVRY